MADKDIVFDGHAFANEGMTGYFAVGADGGVLLDFDECADLGVVADRTAIEIDEFGKLDVTAEADVGTNADEIFFFDRH